MCGWLGAAAVATLCLRAALCLLAAGSGEGTDGACKTFSLQVYRGENGSLTLPINASRQNIVYKYDPEKKRWKDLVLTLPEHSISLMGKTQSISLVKRNFTVSKAEREDQGLYKIKTHLDDKCLGYVNLTVLDRPSPVTPSSNVSSTVICNITKTAEASPPGTHGTRIYIGVPIAFIVVSIIIGTIVLWAFKKKRPNESRPVTDPGPCMNGSLSGQQCEITAVQ